MNNTTRKRPKSDSLDKAKGQPYRVRLPGFISEEIGLGDVIKRATSSIGIKPCGGCQRRAERLNRWIVFSR
ncbi:MAG TPA: hypothetical protein VKB86_02125 [Pyrinomonadaceae bacterium]|nr:hypothetical protein [Pyrinomonadaceae bacterium]